MNPTSLNFAPPTRFSTPNTGGVSPSNPQNNNQYLNQSMTYPNEERFTSSQMAQPSAPIAYPGFNDPQSINPNTLQNMSATKPYWDTSTTMVPQYQINPTIPDYYKYPMSQISVIPPVQIQQAQTTPSGLKIQDITLGTGDIAKPGDVIVVHYVGRLKSDNSVFDQNTADDPFTFRLGAGSVIQGWDEGLVGMRVGGKRQLEIPPELAYGAEGSGEKIPSNSTLIFEVEFLRKDQA